MVKNTDDMPNRLDSK